MLEIEEAFNILEEEYKKQKTLLNKIHTIKEYLFDLEADLEEEKAENNEKAEIIDKAIEYIKQYEEIYYPDEPLSEPIITYNIGVYEEDFDEAKLLDILRGEE